MGRAPGGAGVTWTTEKPEQPGKYLYRTRYSFARTVRVSRRRDGWWCTFPDGSSCRAGGSMMELCFEYFLVWLFGGWLLGMLTAAVLCHFMFES